MAVPVEERTAAFGVEPRTIALRPLPLDKFLEKQALTRHNPGALRAHQLGVLVAKRKEARRLEPDDRSTLARHSREPRDIVSRHTPGLVQHALRDHRASATSAVGKRHPIPETF